MGRIERSIFKNEKEVPRDLVGQATGAVAAFQPGYDFLLLSRLQPRRQIGVLDADCILEEQFSNRFDQVPKLQAARDVTNWLSDFGCNFGGGQRMQVVVSVRFL